MTKATESNIQTGRRAMARVKYLRIAPRKMRPVINVIRYQHPEKALYLLASVNKKSARMIEKLLKSAVANAKVLGMDHARLTISDIRADGGPVMKRLMERSMGRADRLVKRTTHLTIILTEGTRKFTTLSAVESKTEEKALPKAAKTKDKKKAAAAKG